MASTNCALLRISPECIIISLADTNRRPAGRGDCSPGALARPRRIALPPCAARRTPHAARCAAAVPGSGVGDAEQLCRERGKAPLARGENAEAESGSALATVRQSSRGRAGPSIAASCLLGQKNELYSKGFSGPRLGPRP